MKLPSLGRVAILCLSYFSAPALAEGVFDGRAAELRSCGSMHGALLSTQTYALPPIDIESTAEVGESIIASAKVDVMGELVTTSSQTAFTGDIMFLGTCAGADFDARIHNVALKSSELQYAQADYWFKYKHESEPRGWSRPDIWLSLDASTGRIIATLRCGFSKHTYPTDGFASTTTTKSKTESCVVVGPEGFRKELVYSGVSQGSISLLYREFLGDMARPAFSQELHYDLKEGNEIGFKGARFKVIKATNSKIRYKVLKPLQ